MSSLGYLIALSLLLGIAGLAAFLWSMRSGQYEDLDGAAARILLDDEDRPLPGPTAREQRQEKRREPGSEERR